MAYRPDDHVGNSNHMVIGTSVTMIKLLRFWMYCGIGLINKFGLQQSPLSLFYQPRLPRYIYLYQYILYTTECNSLKSIFYMHIILLGKVSVKLKYDCSFWWITVIFYRQVVKRHKVI